MTFLDESSAVIILFFFFFIYFQDHEPPSEVKVIYHNNYSGESFVAESSAAGVYISEPAQTLFQVFSSAYFDGNDWFQIFLKPLGVTVHFRSHGGRRVRL